MKKSISIIIVICGFGLSIGGGIYNHYYHQKIKQSPIAFAYQTYFGPPNSVLIIESLSQKKELIKYYDSISVNPKSNPIITVPIKTLPQYYPVYVVGYSKDSLLVEIVSYYNRGKLHGGSYLRGWIDRRTLHIKPAIRPI